MSVTIVPQFTESTNPEPFDTAMHVDARFAGGTVTVDQQHEEWLGETLVKLHIPGLPGPLMLRTFEARDLAAALQNVALVIDEEVAK